MLIVFATLDIAQIVPFLTEAGGPWCYYIKLLLHNILPSVEPGTFDRLLLNGGAHLQKSEGFWQVVYEGRCSMFKV